MPHLTFNCLQSVSSGLTWVDLLSERAAQQPSRIAFQIWNDGAVSSDQLTYADLDCRSRAIAARMQRLNLKGERVLLLCPPGLDYVLAFCACLYAGAIAVPIYPPRPNQSLERFQGIVDDAQAVLILTASAQQFQPETLAALPTLNLHAVNAAEAAAWQPPNLQPEETAFLQYTSGSTSAPKGVQISHGNLSHNVAAISHKFGLNNQSAGVCWLPPYHDMGLIGGILTSLYQGATTTLMSPVDFLQRPLRWLQAISHTQATISGGPNFAYERCVEKIKPEQCVGLDLSRWSVAFTGAEPIRMATLERFVTRFAEYGFRPEAFYPCYGMAESTLMITGGETTSAPKQLTVDEENLTAHRIQPATQGRVLVGCGQVIDSGQLEIVNPQTLKRCQPNEVGEIWVASPSVTQGYWQQPQLSQETFQAHLADTGAGPFLRTGDLGCVQGGELYVTGRLKEVMIINGRNHYASDVEATVAASHPAFGSTWGAAFTVDQHHQTQLVIVQEVGRMWLRRLEPEPVMRAIRQTVSRVHGLRAETIVLVKPGSIPKTSSGKIQRSRCRSQYLAEQLRLVPMPATTR
ncbi:amp-dependent synthetase and ligase [Leptolyngbya sp. Heron Island J]|uniref:fatty acyl-AMP ligase n=1 Tax=Leptolyngbya sp. Heron Island J TaxID=1385935 RepID=UPI0003B93A7D|nr:fatty acyl-AMP ligase [Leptolyngbya sp. Heron Island J]ESA33425.1 amp-dependent synthetase and ligase [Leptolyngbya sp. Heron Island J]